MKKRAIVKLILVGIVIILFVITLPALHTNNKRFNQVRNEARLVLNEGLKICSSQCANYPAEWVKEGQEVEAELYCMRQCSNNMENIREEIAEDSVNRIFKDKYHYKVEKVYCVIGMRCFSLEMKDFIYSYKS